MSQKQAFIISALSLQAAGAAAAPAAVIYEDYGKLSTESQVSAYEWRNDSTPPKAVIVFVHGFTQQGKSAERFAEQLAKQGYLVLAMDLRGHGRWQQLPEPELRTVNYKASVGDLTRLCRAVREAYPGVPLYCVGESTGSALVAHVAARDKSLMDGAILSSAGTNPRCFNVFWVVTDFLSNCFRLNHPVSLRKYIAKYASNDPRVIAEMLNDPLSRNDMSAREIFGTAFFLSRTPVLARRISPQLPILVIQGAQDHILQPSTVKPLMKVLRSANKEVVEFPNYGHVLLGTSYINQDVAGTVENWLKLQLGEADSEPELSVTGCIPEQAIPVENSKAVLQPSHHI